jgi:hypothetical protein
VNVRAPGPQSVAIDETSIVCTIEFPLLFTIGVDHCLECGEANVVAFLWCMRTYTHVLVNEEEENLFELRVQVAQHHLRQVDANLTVHIGLARARFCERLATVMKKAEEEGGLGTHTINIAIVRTNQATT